MALPIKGFDRVRNILKELNQSLDTSCHLVVNLFIKLKFFLIFSIESAERERREALLKKNQEREGKIIAKKKAQNAQTYFAFGSCTPRMGYSISGKTDTFSF